MDTSKFNLTIVSREGVVFQGSVDSITSFNATGRFDILGQHSNFISLITKEIIIRKGKETPTSIKISNALIKVLANNVKIYLGIDWFSNTNKEDIYS